jgi:4'-phosphopantetheinyl transferase EntD
MCQSRGEVSGSHPRDALIGDLFDAAVLTASCAVTDDATDLHPEERLLVARAADRRRNEFAAGRRCARALLAQLGHSGMPLLRNDDRAPCWPAGVVGSISHSDALCVVAVARRATHASLGVDVEPDAPLEPRIWRRVCTPAEIERLVGAAPAAERGQLARLVFSAKEATYKSVYPLLGRVFGFQDVELSVDFARRRFTPRLAATIAAQLPPGVAPEGRFARRGGFLFAAATVLAS